jgi:hypothetical protein
MLDCYLLVENLLYADYMTKTLDLQGKYHFSVDDVFEEMLRISDCGGVLFDSPVFAFFKEMHDLYGAHIYLYLFYEKDIDGKIRSLKDIRSFKEELSSIDWIHYAPHAQSFEIIPFNQTIADFENVCENIYQEIERISGKKIFASIIRLHFYSEMYEMAEYFLSKNVTALYTTDKPVGAYRLPEECRKLLVSKGVTFFNGIHFLRTQFRVENFTGERLLDQEIRENFLKSLHDFGCITLYSHEYELHRSEVRNVARRCFRILNEIQLKSVIQ